MPITSYPFALPRRQRRAWPDYATTIIEDTIDGRPVVIQPWTGLSQRFLQAGPQTSYWRNKWMNPHRYRRYGATRKNEGALPWWLPGNTLTPPFSVGYRQRYRINGKRYPVW